MKWHPTRHQLDRYCRECVFRPQEFKKSKTPVVPGVIYCGDRYFLHRKNSGPGGAARGWVRCIPIERIETRKTRHIRFISVRIWGWIAARRTGAGCGPTQGRSLHTFRGADAGDRRMPREGWHRSTGESVIRGGAAVPRAGFGAGALGNGRTTGSAPPRGPDGPHRQGRSAPTQRAIVPRGWCHQGRQDERGRIAWLDDRVGDGHPTASQGSGSAGAQVVPSGDSPVSQPGSVPR
jgi:hypothetical protein